MADYHFNVFWSDEDGCYVATSPTSGSAPRSETRQRRPSGRCSKRRPPGSSRPGSEGTPSPSLGTAPLTPRAEAWRSHGAVRPRIREHLPELRRGKSYGCTRLIDGTRSRPRSKETTRSRSHTSAAAAR